MAADAYNDIVNVGVTHSPRLVAFRATCGSGGSAGKVTVTAVSVGLNLIKGIAGATAWGATTGTGLMVCTTTAFAAAGVTSVDLEVVDDGSTLTASIVVTGLVWGE